MNSYEIEKNFHSIMKGNVSMNSSHIEKLTIIKKINYKTESLNQARLYGKWERNT